MHGKLLISQNCGDISTPNLNKEIFYNNNIQSWLKRVYKKSKYCQDSVVKTTPGVIQLSDNLLKLEKQNYAVNTKDLLSLAFGSTILLEHANFSMNNVRNRIKNNLYFLSTAGDLPTTLLLGDDLPIEKGKEASKITYHPLSKYPRHTRYNLNEMATQPKAIFLLSGDEHKT